MKKELITQAQEIVVDLLNKRHAAVQRFLAKRKELNKKVQDDATDLFGSRKPQAPGMLFEERASPGQIKVILEPFQAEIRKLDEDIAKWEKDLVRLSNMPETDLFTQSIPAA
jgi:hypothetical protein